MTTKLDHRIRDLRGQTFGRLRVVEFAGIRERSAYWICECECGQMPVVRGHSMTHGNTVSCGCQRRDPEIKRAVRLQLPPEQRRKIARRGGIARHPVTAKKP